MSILPDGNPADISLFFGVIPLAEEVIGSPCAPELGKDGEIRSQWAMHYGPNFVVVFCFTGGPEGFFFHVYRNRDLTQNKLGRIVWASPPCRNKDEYGRPATPERYRTALLEVADFLRVRCPLA